MESSPPFKTTDSCYQHNSTYPCHNGITSTKLRLMCSNGGHIVPRPHDKSLRYVGGETRILAVDRHTTLLDLTRHLSKTLYPSSSYSFTLKYQLPSEDLDSLISVTTDEDLENMIDEYERLNSSSRLRLFIFPTNPDPISIGSFLENPIKSEDWFLNALNGSNSGFSDTSSVNCLLDLDDEINIVDKKDVDHKNTIVQDVHSIPDSPMMETTSSFGSVSSTPSQANLSPIKVNADDRLKIVGGGIEEQFSHMGGQKRHHKYNDDAGMMGSPAPLMGAGLPMSAASAIQELSDPFFYYHERSEQQQQQKQSTGFDFSSMDSIVSGFGITDQSSPVSQVQSSGYNNRVVHLKDTPDQHTRIQMLQPQKIQNPAYLSSMPATQLDSPRHQLHHQQPQLIQPLQYMHHHPSVAVSVTSYCHYHHHHPPTNQQNIMYYIPIRQPSQGSYLPFTHADMPPVTTAPNSQTVMKTELPVYRTTNSGVPRLVRVPSNVAVGYSQIHQPTQAAMPPLSTDQYKKLTPVSTVEANLQKHQVTTAQP